MQSKRDVLHTAEKSNDFALKGKRYFSTYLMSSLDTMISYKHATNVWAILKHMQDAHFQEFCETFLNSDPTEIEIEFFLFDESDKSYREAHYHVILNNEGIIDEFIDGARAMSRVRETNGPFSSVMPGEFTDYFAKVMVYDLDDSLHEAEMRSIFQEAIEQESFRRFVVNVAKITPHKPVNIYKDPADPNLIYSKFSDGKLVEYHDLPSDLQMLYNVTWTIYVAFIKSGVVVLGNLDLAFDDAILKGIIELFNKSEKLGFNKAQLIFTSFTKPKVYPEQIMLIERIQNFHYCTWQNY
jgi:hypothetical protein